MAWLRSLVVDVIIGWWALPAYYRSSLTTTFILALSFAFMGDYAEAIPNLSSSGSAAQVPHCGYIRFGYEQIFFLRFAASSALVGTG